MINFSINEYKDIINYYNKPIPHNIHLIKKKANKLLCNNMLKTNINVHNKILYKLKSKHQKLIASRSKVAERKKLLMGKIKEKPTTAQKQQLEKIKDALIVFSEAMQVLSEEMQGAKHGLTKIKMLQKQRAMEAKVLEKFRKEQEKKNKKSKK